MSLNSLVHNALNELHYPLEEAALRPMNNPIGMLFGHVRRDPHGHLTVHQGWDLVADVGSSVLAISGGEVVWSQNWNGHKSDAYGNRLLVTFSHRGKTHYAFYAHLDDIVTARSGTSINRGQVLGYSGVTGNGDTSSPHLHLEVRNSTARLGQGLGGRIDPGDFFPELLKSPRQKAR